MRKIFMATMLLGMFMGVNSTPLVEAEAPPIPIVKPSVDALISRYSALYGVSSRKVRNILYCESHLSTKAIGDGGRSYGIAQIYLPAHPNITKAQALDPDFSIRYLALNLSTGRGYMWTCYRMLYT